MVDLADAYPYVPVKYPYVGGTKWNFMKWADIPDARDLRRVYLRRLRIVQTPWFALYLHFIYLPDEDRAPHDHPFSFRSMILRGGYRERVWNVCWTEPERRHILPGLERRTWRRFSVHATPRTVAHIIEYLKPGTVTLVWAGPKKQEWGFYPINAKWVPWAEYNRSKYAVDEHS